MGVLYTFSGKIQVFKCSTAGYHEDCRSGSHHYGLLFQKGSHPFEVCKDAIQFQQNTVRLKMLRQDSGSCLLLSV